MIPEHRLAVLLDDVKRNWIENCLYHNTSKSPSLYVDHCCERDVFPTKSVMELKNHKDEVWYLKYSNNGNMLASTSRDKTVVIYDSTTYKVIHQLNDHEAGVTHLAWSPDDTKFITCSTQQDCSARIWDVRVRQPMYIFALNLTFSRQGDALVVLAISHTPALRQSGRRMASLLSLGRKIGILLAPSGIWKAN